MSDLNVVVVVGHLTKDCELSYTNGGTAIGKFSIAVNKEYSANGERKKEVSFFDVKVWGKGAEALGQYLTRGKAVAIEGELSQERWEQDGQTRSRIVITSKSIQLLGGGQARTSIDPEGVSF